MIGFLWFIVIVCVIFVIWGVYWKLFKEKNYVPPNNNYSMTDRSILHKDANSTLNENLLSNETVKVIILGMGDSALIGTERRVFIFKKGITGGVTLGTKLTSWDYKNLTGVQLETGKITGVLSLQGPGIMSQDLSSWSFLNDNKNDAWSVPHALVIGQVQLEGARRGVVKLRELISEAQQPVSSASTGINDLEKLAGLKEKGIITEEEFNQKKKQLLGL